MSASVPFLSHSVKVQMSFLAPADAPDLHDPITGRSLSPVRVDLELLRHETPERGVRESAFVAVFGPRRLKSGKLGAEISSFHWNHDRVRRHLSDLGGERPEWLTAELAEHLPEGWDSALLHLPVTAAGGTR
ncbi:hypothetical protein OG897_13255 [Streptomyces sp. NBC_00237]|uniref:hypothetical protein n=1 Tax=Streptomyces sp. NBC_00237 TaxID=2975687 RepID=UPI002259464F|nr:hypothetical protein [Streptomyces sp. NBC_00237]MCX5202410.1 hypothetical protein [Streptomyces sp. NBC_00237]